MTRKSISARLGARIGCWHRDEDGFATAFGIIWTILILLIGGIAVDASNAWRNRAMLQATADAAAHAAVQKIPPPLMQISSDNKDAIRAEAIRIARAHLDPARYGEVVIPENVVIGRWDDATGTIDTTAQFANVVRVKAQRVQANGNAVATILLKLGILNSWDVGASAAAMRFLPKCTRDGIISAKTAEITSGNEILSPFCLHGQTGVAMSNDNSFELGTIVSMPDLSMLDLPTAGLTSNPGLAEALSTDFLPPRMVAKIDMLFEELQDIRSPEQPDYISNGYGHLVTLTHQQFDATALTPQNIYVVECGNVTGALADTASNKQIKFETGAVADQNVIVTNCAISISAGALISDAVLITSNTSSSSISGSASAQVGNPDDCTPGGGAVLISKGDIGFSSNALFHDAQLVAANNVHISAAPGGITGIAIQSGGDTKLTASGGFALCPNRDDPVYIADFYKFVN